MKGQVLSATNSAELFETESGRGVALGGPPLQRGVSCGAVARQVKGDTSRIEKSFQKYLGNFKKDLALSPRGHGQVNDHSTDWSGVYVTFSVICYLQGRSE